MVVATLEGATSISHVARGLCARNVRGDALFVSAFPTASAISPTRQLAAIVFAGGGKLGAQPGPHSGIH